MSTNMTRFGWFSIIFVFLGDSSLSIGRIIGVFIELSCDYQGPGYVVSIPMFATRS